MKIGRTEVSAFISTGRSASQNAHIVISTLMSLTPSTKHAGFEPILAKFNDMLPKPARVF